MIKPLDRCDIKDVGKINGQLQFIRDVYGNADKTIFLIQDGNRILDFYLYEKSVKLAFLNEVEKRKRNKKKTSGLSMYKVSLKLIQEELQLN